MKRDNEEENVRYFSAAERENHRIFPSNGLLMKISTQMKDDFSSLVLHRFDTSEEKTFDEKGSAIYVVSPKGDIFAGTTIPRVIQHSSFLAGMATIASGSLNATEGHYKKADDFSGHYMPQFQQAIQAITFFRKARLLISPTIYESFDENTFSMKTFQVHSAPMSKK